MELTEYQRKLAMYMTSNAPTEVKEKAIKQLRLDYYGPEDAVDVAKQQLEEGKAEVSNFDYE